MQSPGSPAQSARPKYRADIDGLRAVAVLAVVGFHAFPDAIKGGFIGVDIFFVISGFLISTIIIEGLKSGTFSFADFYTRRIRRIFPALFVVLAACLALGWFTLLADEYMQLGKHIAGGAGFVSNFVLWKESGYFDSAAETKPLLHLWSLGIEEQFYLVWPLLLWLAWRINRLAFAVIAIVGGASFVFNLVNSNPVAAFYSPLTRFWELLAGSALTYVALLDRQIFREFVRTRASSIKRIWAWPSDRLFALPEGVTRQALRDTQSIAAAALIVAGLAIITKEKHFPGVLALLPVLGAVLIIAAGERAWLNRVVLSSRVLVWFGLISFPLYLWHWPLLSFSLILEGDTLSGTIRVAAVIVSITLAWLTYKLIERPLRFGSHGRIIASGLFVLMAFAGLAGYYGYRHNGLPLRSAERLYAVNPDDFKKYLPEASDRWICADPRLKDAHCDVSGAGMPTAVVIGDSHARSIYYGLKDVYLEQGKNLALLSQAGCPPYLNLTWTSRANGPEHRCVETNSVIIDEIIEDSSIKEVIITSRGPIHVTGVGFGRNEKDVRSLLRLNHEPYGRRSNEESFKLALLGTLSALEKAGKIVIFLHDVPELEADPRTCIRRRGRLSAKNNCVVDYLTFSERYRSFKAAVDPTLRSFSNVRVINLSDALCDETYCYVAHNRRSMYVDTHHLNRYGAVHVAQRIKGELADVFAESSGIPSR